MKGEPGQDYPEQMTPVDVLAASRGDALASFVEAVHDTELILTVGTDRGRRPVRLDPGERLELVWKAASELRAVPAELVDTQAGDQPTWRIRTVGPATRGQRRAAVRAPLVFRVHLGPEDGHFDGQTVDLSEGGIRLVQAAVREQDRAANSSARGAAGLTRGQTTARAWLLDAVPADPVRNIAR